MVRYHCCGGPTQNITQKYFTDCICYENDTAYLPSVLFGKCRTKNGGKILKILAMDMKSYFNLLENIFTD
jgi:hypothetical protein